MRRTIGGLVAALLVLAAAFGLAPARAGTWTSSSYAARLVQLVNQARQQHGLPVLTVASGTSQVAAAWTAHLDATKSLAHNPDLQHQLETHGSPNWTTYGENVGQGPSGDPDALFKAYMNSTEHRDNILNGAYRFTGVSVVLDGSSAWNTFDFVDSYTSVPRSTSTTGTPKPAASHPASAPSTRPVLVSPPAAARSMAVASVTADQVRGRPRRARVRVIMRSLPHTATRPQADPIPDLGMLLSTGVERSAALVAGLGDGPAPLPRSKQLSIALAGLLLGFTSVRWWLVARAA